MSIKENVNKVLRSVGLKAEEIKLAQMMLADGVTIIEAEAFEPEYSVGIVQEEGIVPLKEGDYILEDGRVLTVEVEGIIASIQDAETEEPTSEEPVAEMSEPEPAQAKKIVESIVKESFFSEMEAMRNEITELKAQLAQKEEAKVELSNQEPAVEAIQHNPEPKEQNVSFRIAPSRAKNTMDRVLEMISK
jgi:Trk K+ transport system NAD-binding subunit